MAKEKISFIDWSMREDARLRKWGRIWHQIKQPKTTSQFLQLMEYTRVELKRVKVPAQTAHTGLPNPTQTASALAVPPRPPYRRPATSKAALPAKQGDFKCVHTGCSFSSNFKNCLVRHAKLHTGEKPFQCKTCGKGFSREDERRAHVKAHYRTQKPKGRRPKRSRRLQNPQ